MQTSCAWTPANGGGLLCKVGPGKDLAVRCVVDPTVSCNVRSGIGRNNTHKALVCRIDDLRIKRHREKVRSQRGSAGGCAVRIGFRRQLNDDISAGIRGSMVGLVTRNLRTKSLQIMEHRARLGVGRRVRELRNYGSRQDRQDDDHNQDFHQRKRASRRPNHGSSF